MVDILDRADGRQFLLCGAFRRFAEPRTGRSEATERAAAIEEAQVAAAEAHDMVSVLELGQPDELAHQRLADERELAPPLDVAFVAHPPHLMKSVVPGILEALRHGAGRGLVDFGRRPLGKRLVRALLVIVAAEFVEASLLLLGVGGRRLRGLFL